jgi:hypothetical protein
MDGVVADFWRAIQLNQPRIDDKRYFPTYADQEKEVDAICERNPHIFKYLLPIKGAIEATKPLFKKFDVYFLSTPMWDIPESYTDKNVKLVVVNKTDFGAYDRFIDRLYKRNLLELKIIEDFSEFEADALGDEELNIEDTMSLLNSFVESTETDADKSRIKILLKELYLEAQNQETA